MKKAKDDNLKGKTGDLKDDKLLKDFKQGCGMVSFTFQQNHQCQQYKGLIEDGNGEEREKGQETKAIIQTRDEPSME